MARVKLLEVSKVYPGGIRAVDRVNLEIADREFVVLVGPSGCGKTTTLRMIAGLEEITAGTIQIGDRVVNELAPKDRDIAMVFQNYALYPHMSVYKNMAFGLRLRGFRDADIRQRVSDVARVLEIEGLLDRKPPALSGGQRQRVAVGRAIVRNPAAFLFDEPLSNLDAKLRVTTRSELKRLHQRLQTTTVYVTHDQEEAMTLGDRIVVMKDGLIQQADAPLATYHSPANRFVAGFIGMPPMNFFDGMIMMVGGEMVFQEGAPSSDGRIEPSEQGFRFPLPARLTGRLAGRVGQHVVLGIRPEHLLTRPLDPLTDSVKVTFKVNVIEPLGNVVDVYMSTNLNDHVVARVEAESVQGGALTGGLRTNAPAALHVDLRKVHVFEPGETGMNLSLTNEPAHAVA